MVFKGYNREKLLSCFWFLFLLAGPVLPLAGNQDPTVFTKLSPPDVTLETEGGEIELLAVNGYFRAYSFPPGPRLLTLSAEGYEKKILTLTVRDGMLLEEKLERLDSRLRLVGEYSSGKHPKSAEFSPDGRYLVVPLLDDTGVELYGTNPFTCLGMITFPEEYARQKGFVESAFIPGTNELWVSQMSTGLVHVIDTLTWTWKGVYNTGGLWPKVLTPSPDGRYCCVSNWNSGTVSFLETATGRIRALVPVRGTPRGMAFSADGAELFVCLFDSGDIDVIDCRSFTVSRSFLLGPGALRHILTDFISSRVYVTDMYNGTVSSVSMNDGSVLRKRYVGPNPNTLRLSPDASVLYVSIRGRNNTESYLRKGPEYGKVLALDPETLEVKDWIWGRNQPTGLAVSPDNRLLVFTDFLDDSIEVYRTVPAGDQ